MRLQHPPELSGMAEAVHARRQALLLGLWSSTPLPMHPQSATRHSLVPVPGERRRVPDLLGPGHGVENLGEEAVLRLQLILGDLGNGARQLPALTEAPRPAAGGSGVWQGGIGRKVVLDVDFGALRQRHPRKEGCQDAGRDEGHKHGALVPLRAPS